MEDTSYADSWKQGGWEQFNNTDNINVKIHARGNSVIFLSVHNIEDCYLTSV